MTTSDAMNCIELLAANYGFWASRLTDRQMALLAQTWATQMGDLDAKVVNAALAKLLSTAREYPPDVGTVNETARAMLDTAQNGEMMDAGQAWRKVCGAVTGFANGVAWDASRKSALSEEAIKAAEDFGLMRIRMRLEEDEGTNFAQFRGMYETYSRRRREQRALPPAIREQMAQLAGAFDAKRALSAKPKAVQP